MLTVLFVDDDLDLLASVEAAASMVSAMRLLTAGTPRLALQKLKEERVDIVVSDENMNEMSGLALLAEIRRTHPRIRLVLNSGMVTAEMRDKAQQVGVEKILSKPFRLGDLVSLLGSKPGPGPELA
ncbi:MAG: response regulator [Euryarchaeota archaeon]|nr:response regulator [Euryarchaeota archaeon]